MPDNPSLEDVRDALQRNPGLSLGECIVRMERAEARATKALDAGMREAVEYATRLAQVLHDRHFREVTHWEPLGDLVGVLMQIDNMTAGLSRTKPAETQFNPDYLCPNGCAAQDALKEQLEARAEDRAETDRLRKDNVRLRKVTEDVKQRCLIAESDHIAVTEEPHIDLKLFDQICDALSATEDLSGWVLVERETTGWEIIDSVPRDGTLVDLWMQSFFYNADGKKQVAVEMRVPDAVWRRDGWVNEDGNPHEYLEGFTNVEFTHWMRRPERPADLDARRRRMRYG